MDFELYAVRVFVTDWERAVRFYTETLGIPAVFRSDEMGWMQLATGQGQLALERVRAGAEAPYPGSEEPLVGRFVGVSLRVDDIHHAYKTLIERGVSFLSPPELQPWGGVLAHFRDPDGNVLTLLGAPKEGGAAP